MDPAGGRTLAGGGAASRGDAIDVCPADGKWATIRLPDLLNALEQRSVAEVELQQMAANLQVEDEKRREAIQSMQDRLEAMTEDQQVEAIALGESLRLELLKYEGWRRFELDRLDIEKSLLLRDIYRSVRDGIADFADENGYGIVLVDDVSAELSLNPNSQMARETQIRQQILSRRVLHTSDATDITEDLIRRMNNAYNAGG